MASPEPDPLAEPALRFRQRLGDHIRAVRLARGLNQDELAFRAGLHRSHITLLEKGRRDPQLATLYRIATALALTPSQLLDIPDK